MNLFNLITRSGTFAVIAFYFLSGCQTIPYQPYARDVKRKPQQGGIIALKSEHREEDRAKAQSLMASNCGATQPKVLEEGEVVIGEKTDAKTDQNTNLRGSSAAPSGTLFGVPLISNQPGSSSQAYSESSRTQLKEWQISYECEKGAESTLKTAGKGEGESAGRKIKK